MHLLECFLLLRLQEKMREKGLVINIVTPNNITEVTSETHANAMLTAGIQCGA